VRELLPGEDVPESLREGVLQKAEGNPFYVEEIVRMLIDRGILLHDPEGAVHVALEWEGGEEQRDPATPDTGQGGLAAGLDLLSQPERDVLQHAAVIGRYFWPEALRHLHAESNGQDLDAVVASLMAKDLIRETERPQTLTTPAGEPFYTFNHAL